MLAGRFTLSETLVGIVGVVKRRRHSQLFERRAPQVAVKAAAAAVEGVEWSVCC